MILKDKRIAFLGDSITEGTGVTDKENNRYDNILKRECQLKQTYNYGIGGTRIAHQQSPSAKARFDLCFCGRAYDLDKAADIIVVFGGVNDFAHGDAPIGQFGDTTPATFYGAVRYLMNLLKTEHPGKTIVFMSPARVFLDGADGEKPSTRPTKRADALPLPGYIRIIRETAALFDIPVLDLYENLGIDPGKEEDRLAYTTDGVHFNDAGHRRIAKCLRAFLESL